jgi:hypothetical protein
MPKLAYLPHPEATAIVEGDIEPVLPADVREAMLNLILAFANLDGATAFLAASLSGLGIDKGAERFGRKIVADKLKAASKALSQAGRQQEARFIDEISADYVGRALIRKRIAHARCAGVRKSDATRVIFLPYEREGPAGHFAVEVHGIETIRSDAAWAEHVGNTIMAYVDATGFFYEVPASSLPG